MRTSANNFNSFVCVVHSFFGKAQNYNFIKRNANRLIENKMLIINIKKRKRFLNLQSVNKKFNESMKKKLLFKLLLLNSFIIVYSCSDENSFSELNNDNFMIEDYHGFYAQYSTSSIFFLPDSDNLVKFEY